MTYEEAISLYLDEIKNRCEMSSYKTYRKRLVPFRIEFGAMQLTDVSSDYVLMLIKDLCRFPDGREKAPDTIRHIVQAWEQLQAWLLDDDRKYLAEPITKKKIKKPGGRKREALPTKDETKAILATAAPDFALIYRALRLTGARPGELCAAQISDIDRVAGEIIREKHKTAKKTGKPRRIALGHPALIAIVDQAIGDRTEGPIFLRSNGKSWKTEIVSTAFRKARDAAGLRKILVLYLARHEHATTLYRETGDLKVVADALGHTQLTTTMRYTRVDSAQLKKNQQLFNEGLD